MLLGAAVFFIFVEILPLGTGTRSLPTPDLVLCLLLAWALRRPEFVPFPVVALIGLTTDFLFLRAPGLWTIVLILTIEAARRQVRSDRTISPLEEMVMVLGFASAAILGNALLLLFFGVAGPSLGSVTLGLVFTVLAYPLVALATVFIFRVNRIDPKDGI